MIPAEAVEAARGVDQFRDALGDYYDSGAIGDPPKREDYPA